MNSFLFLHSEMKDPYSHYDEMLNNNPVIRDATAHCRIIYSYDLCKLMLTSKDTLIPPVNLRGLNEEATAIAGRLARLSNEPHHSIASMAAMQLFRNIKQIPVEKIISRLLPNKKYNHEIDWVSAVGKRLPVLSILEGLDCSAEDAEFIIENIQDITAMMQPVKSEKETARVNNVFQVLYPMLRRHILGVVWLRKLLDEFAASGSIDMEEALELFISNLAGLIIQCYDAGNGILTNALLHFIKDPGRTGDFGDRAWISKSVIEVLRFNPPVHNTRRIAARNICLGQHEIKKDELIVVMLAAANRDEKQFLHANCFDSERKNNNEHLTFGFGAHNCIAREFSTSLATEVLYYLFNTYPRIVLLEQDLQFEPKMNVRLMSQLRISLS